MELNGLRVSRETQGRLQHFAILFQKWAKTINLVAPSTLDDLWRRHVADSSQIFQICPQPITWADLGSGGGFPGVITAIFLAELQDGWVHLVESNHKKAAFLRTALRETNARGSVHAIRIEDAHAEIGDCGAISARALTDLDRLIDYSAPWMLGKQNCRGFFHKGRDYLREIEEARGRWEFDLLEHKSAVEQESVILEISNLRRLV
ncbi:16S rRNA (guanine(527)-N(7))-methyltransferase RsmG [Rhizobium lentis]|uniref:16S rRNA (guanine(527)-N(7))-methyltransferase RsmG n=1 Tax=Rhizobium lentis TaxID=1138194 RepID=UPI001C82B00A|nr:16S rRNA (guanine(527)-N(7))-methyltransferase RsmG [Rhizobium lentis]MBX4958523.1 16S rRNA (guanine(527)-N(7))-methyltransferase RsmG [Rhizobium lentis]MBX4988529.1 16S rRNA (guanine(527)-N(7))-methyltransferase RsmG [Rhizobium lentis]MBX5006978.1 16S rRNA (guanine(527)-N(7))-methyltransferase RsmG [Rhizobium lentis]MBX5031574.1 16S rRNA (guanine(527)-N(7))-methyltransferase RsmG [Rhizobium lentis]MBX5037713.1 16S rRNA (guanine(527)-N(7))-methyltransferase RsmG [Rhizobium lentis]